MRTYTSFGHNCLKGSARTKKWVGGAARSSLAVTDVQPARPIALPARFLIPAPGSEAGRASLPVGFVCSASDNAGTALARSHLRALAIDHLHRVRQRAAARANGHRWRFLASFLFRFGIRRLVRHGHVQPTPNLFILETTRPSVKRVASHPFYFSHSGRAAKSGSVTSLLSTGWRPQDSNRRAYLVGTPDLFAGGERAN
jgi:hypothetical protein